MNNKDDSLGLSIVIMLFVVGVNLALVVMLLVGATTKTHDVRKSCEIAGGVEVNSPEGPICISNTVLIKVSK